MNVKLCTDETIMVDFATMNDRRVRIIDSIDIPFECKELSEKYPEARGVFFLLIHNEETMYLYYYAEEHSTTPVYIGGDGEDNRLSMSKEELIHEIVKSLYPSVELGM